MVEGNIGMKKGDVKMSDIDTEMMTERVQLEVEPPLETRPE
jgi:hypothetical protein